MTNCNPYDSINRVYRQFGRVSIWAGKLKGNFWKMGFCLTDLADENHNVFINFWNWRPTVELIGSFEIIDKEQLDLIGQQCLGAKVSREEAFQIGIRIRDQVLPNLTDEQRILLDLTSTTEAHDGEFHQGEDSHKSYSTSKKWLEQFSEFCLTCNGFSVF